MSTDIQKSMQKLDPEKLSRLLLIARDERKFARLMDALTAAVVLSDRVYPMSGAIIVIDGGVTARESRRRLTWVVDWALHRITDDGWALQRVVDKCYPALAAWIRDGKERQESKRNMWSATERTES